MFDHSSGCREFTSLGFVPPPQDNGRRRIVCGIEEVSRSECSGQGGEPAISRVLGLWQILGGRFGASGRQVGKEGHV